MSYILDAIRRSERERLNVGRSGLPVLPAFGEAAKRPPLLRYGAASAALIAAGVAIGWLRPWQPDRAAVGPVIAKVSAVPNRPVAVANAEVAPVHPAPLAAPPITENAEVLRVMRVKPHRAPARVAESEPARATRDTPAAAQRPLTVVSAATHRASSVASAVTAPVAPTRASVAASAVAASPAAKSEAAMQGGSPVASAGAPVALTTVIPISTAVTKQAASKGKVVTLYELPPAILRDIPPMAISGFTYSDAPQGRMVDINDRLLQEGQYVADGLKLEQITRDGLIFSYRHYRFRKSVQ